MHLKQIKQDEKYLVKVTKFLHPDLQGAYLQN